MKFKTILLATLSAAALLGTGCNRYNNNGNNGYGGGPANIANVPLGPGNQCMQFANRNNSPYWWSQYRFWMPHRPYGLNGSYFDGSCACQPSYMLTCTPQGLVCVPVRAMNWGYGGGQVATWQFGMNGRFSWNNNYSQPYFEYSTKYRGYGPVPRQNYSAKNGQTPSNAEPSGKTSTQTQSQDEEAKIWGQENDENLNNSPQRNEASSSSSNEVETVAPPVRGGGNRISNSGAPYENDPDAFSDNEGYENEGNFQSVQQRGGQGPYGRGPYGGRGPGYGCSASQQSVAQLCELNQAPVNGLSCQPLRGPRGTMPSGYGVWVRHR